LKNKGATLIELMVVLLILGVAGGGLGSVYVIGWDARQKAELKIRLQQNGSFALEECAKAVQGASGIILSDNGFSTTLPALDSLPARQMAFKHKGNSLYLNDRRIIPFDEFDEDIRLDVFTAAFDSVFRQVRIHMQLSWQGRNQVSETMWFNTSLVARNLR
jgi:prepilin-type N-terminal cleavage/methylation domain-containing protein